MHYRSSYCSPPLFARSVDFTLTPLLFGFLGPSGHLALCFFFFCCCLVSPYLFGPFFRTSPRFFLLLFLTSEFFCLMRAPPPFAICFLSRHRNVLLSKVPFVPLFRRNRAAEPVLFPPYPPVVLFSSRPSAMVSPPEPCPPFFTHPPGACSFLQELYFSGYARNVPPVPQPFFSRLPFPGFYFRFAYGTPPGL